MIFENEKLGLLNKTKKFRKFIALCITETAVKLLIPQMIIIDK